MREAEENVVGTLLTTNAWNDDILPIVEPDMFADGMLGKMYFEIRKAYEAGKEPDVSTVARVVSVDYTEDIVVGVLHEAIQNCQTFQARASAEEIVDEHNARTVNRILSEVKVTSANVYDATEKIISELSGIKVTGEDSRGADEIAEAHKGEYFTKRERGMVQTGYGELDSDLGGLEGGDMIVIGARPAVGKTAFALQLASQICSGGRKVQMFNLEMTEKQVYERMVAYEGGIPLQRIRTAEGFMNDEERIRYENANGIMGERKNLLVSTGSKSVSEIRKSVKARKPDVVIIDYLQLLRFDGGYQDKRYVEVGRISRAIKGIAIENDIPVVVLTQLNRVSEGREDKEPTMAEIRESGDIEQDASIIILLWNKDKDDKSRKGCKVEKNRHGQVGKYELRFNGSEMRFEEVGDGNKKRTTGGFRKATSAEMDELPFAADET